MAGTDITLTCSKCGQEKSLDCFRRRPGRPERGRRFGRWSSCCDCERSYRQSERGRFLQNKRMADFRVRLKQRDPQELRRREKQGNLRRLYGIGIDEYERLFESQNGKCAICGTTDAGGRWKRRLQVDHNHKTGAIRELLCNGCNAGLGNFKDNESVLRLAIQYLRKHSS